MEPMPEKIPTPISRGVELQKSQIEELQKKAHFQYRRLVDLSREVESKIDTALSQSSDESTRVLAELFEQKHALDQLGYELEEFLLKGFDQRDQLQERWLALEERLSGLA